jgi:hypothetical protein
MCPLVVMGGTVAIQVPSDCTSPFRGYCLYEQLYLLQEKSIEENQEQISVVQSCQAQHLAWGPRCSSAPLSSKASTSPSTVNAGSYCPIWGLGINPCFGSRRISRWLPRPPSTTCSSTPVLLRCGADPGARCIRPGSRRLCRPRTAAGDPVREGHRLMCSSTRSSASRIGSPNGLFPRRCHRLPLTRLRRQPLPARCASGSPSTRRPPAAAARSKAWRG